MAKNRVSDDKGPQLPDSFHLPARSVWNSAINWLKENFSTVILPILAIIILGAGLYFYSTGPSAETPEERSVEATASAGAPSAQTPTDTGAATNQTGTSTTEKSPAPNEVTPIPTPTQTGISDPVNETAQKGDGVTHLARRALKDYLSASSDNTLLTDEHKIFIEDYLKDRVGSRPLKIGESISFSHSSIKSAIQAAQQLSPQQLSNLTHYVLLVRTL